MLTKNPWYKDGAGIISVMAWTTVLGLWVYSIVTGTRIEEWWYLLAITTVAVVSSFLRW